MNGSRSECGKCGELRGKRVARPAGVEPATFGSVDQRSIQLSYGRTPEVRRRLYSRRARSATKNLRREEIDFLAGIGYPFSMKRSSLREPSSALILAIDIGTSSLRTALFDARGRRLVQTTTQEAYWLRVTADGGAELSPQTLRQTLFR